MKKDILKIAGVKSEAEFYKKFPSEADFMAKHGGAFKKAKMGASMVKKQLTQLTDFSNPPQAQSGWHSEWDQDPYAQYSEMDNSKAAYLAEADARNILENPMRTPSVNVPKSAIESKKSVGNNYSIVDFLNTKGKKSDFSTRKALAESYGIKGYTGTAEQNIRLLSNLKGKTPATQKAVSQKQSTEAVPQKKETPAQTQAAKKAEASKLSRAEQYIANDPYFFAEESDPGWIKALDAPFAGLRNLGAKVVLDQDPMAVLKLLAMGAMSNSLIGQTKTMPYNPMQIPEAVGAARAASKALPYATRALPGFDMGGYIPQAQFGQKIGGLPPAYQYDLYDPYSGNVKNTATYNKRTGMINSPTGQVSMADTQDIGFSDTGKKSFGRSVKDLTGNDIETGVQMTSALGKNYQKISAAIEEKKKAKRLSALSPVVLQASGTRPEEIKRRYVRPEDVIVDPGQISSPYGTGTDFLQMAYGGSIGGNPTEIQNMYNPGDIYSDMGYEPLSESDVVKQYRKGGGIPKAQGGMDVIIEGVNTVGDIAAGIIGMGTKKLNKESQQRLGQAAFQSGMQDMQQGQYSAFMEDGGEVGLKYLSHDWQPQVITQFGDYDMKDLLREDPTMDTLRAGGHLKNYTAPSEAAMSTERPMMQMGGELQTHWGGGAETISQNPFLPGDGETIMFRGQSHDESDGQGRTGIGITYGDNPVEVERGEPAVKLQDGGEEESLVVYGNMKIPSYGVSELNDPKAKGKKFKSYINDLSKMEVKQNKIIDKATSNLDTDDINDPYKLLSFNSDKANLTGAYMKLKDIAQKKQLAAGIQNAILDTAGEYGLDSDSLAKGQIKKAKASDMAKFGAKMETAQGGINQPLTPIMPMSTYYRIDPRPYSPMVTDPETKKKLEVAPPVEKKTGSKGKAPVKKTIEAPARIEPFTSIDVPRRSAVDMDITPKVTAKVPDYAKNLKSPAQLAPEEKFDWMDIYRQAQPYLIPSNQGVLDPAQLAPEMFALAANQLEPVQAQTFQPMLEEMPTVSFQDQLNEIQAEANAARRMAGTNPAAQAMISAQAAAAKNKVLGEQLRTNQAMQAEARRRNLGVLNDATLKNLNILDQQYQRQAQAKSATKAQAQAALSSIADKIAKNKLENRTLGVYENMYNYRFGPKGRAYNVNAPMEFNTQLASMSTEDIQKILDQKKGSEKKSGKNGSIVKAIKNL